MTPDDARRLYVLAASSTRTQPTDTEAAAWVWLLDDIDPRLAAVALRAMLAPATPGAKGRPFMPAVSELVAEVRRISGDVPPTVDEALGYYMAGRHDAHPLIGEAARMATWDYRVADVARQAGFDFKANYAGLLHREDRKARDEQLELAGGPIAEAIGAGS